MVYSITSNKAIITGQYGIYDNKVKSASVKYGRNAADNYKIYTEDFNQGYAPVNFSYQYVPKSKHYSLQALMGNVYEELGKKTEVSVDVLNRKFDKNTQEIKKINYEILLRNPTSQVIETNFTTEALDLNNDGKVDISEYATSKIAADMLDKNQTHCDIKNLDGIITNKGEDAALPLYLKKNVQNAKKLFGEIHKTFELNNAMQKFISEPDNLI